MFLPLCFFVFVADCSFPCGFERCYHGLQSWASRHHLGDDFHGKDFSEHVPSRLFPSLFCQRCCRGHHLKDDRATTSSRLMGFQGDKENLLPGTGFRLLPFVAAARVSFTASSLPGAAVTCETLYRSSTAKTSLTGATLVDVPRGPVKLDSELIGYTAGEPVVGCPGVCDHEAPPMMPSAILATGWRIVLTWVMAPLAVLLHAHRETLGFSWLRIIAGSSHRQVGGPLHVCGRG